VLLAAVTGAALALPAHAGYVPRLTVSGDAAPTMTVSVPAPTARVRIVPPAAYDATLDAPPGAVVGTATAAGTTDRLVVDDPARHAADPCAPGPHDAVWTAAALGLSLYVDAAPLTIVVCPPSTLSLAFAPGVWHNPPGQGEFVWSGLFTPADGDEVEARALVRQPALVTLAGRVATRGRIVLFGRLTAGGRRVARAPVRLLAGRRTVAATRTTAAGGYAFTMRLKRTTTFRTRVDAPAQDVTGSVCATGDCVTATLGPLHALSTNFLRVTVRG
jgi:hypothetical protein